MTLPYTTGKQKFDLEMWHIRMTSWCPTICAYCGWRIDGPLAETSPAYQEHRATAHPDLPTPRRRTRLKAGGWQTGAKRIDDNIAGARAVGAGRNAA